MVGQPTLTASGTDGWFSHGKRHRTGGPAYVTASGTDGWCSHGKRHRTGGPAYRNRSGEEFWAIDSHILDSDQVNNWVKENGFTIPFDEPTQMLFLMKFG